MKTPTERLVAIEELRRKMIRTTGIKKDFDKFYGKLLFNEKGNAGIIVRAVTMDETPIVARYNHAFQNRGKWFIIDVCAASIGEPCPICEHVQRLRMAGDAAIAKYRQAKVNYVTNIVVMGDPLRPHNEGKVMLINLPKTVAEKLMDAKDPNLYPPEGFDAWNPETGRNFMVKAVKAKGQSWPSYESSAFVKNPSSLGTPEEIAAILTQCVPLDSILKPSFTYDALAERYARECDVVTPKAASTVSKAIIDQDEAR